MLRPSRAAFSLLEVILALAILAGAIAVIGEAARQAMRNAAAARDLSHAQLLCESKMAEITAGLVQPEPVQNAAIVPLTDQEESGWLYSVEVSPTDQEGLLLLRVTVTPDQPPESHPVQFAIVRWMIDPNYVSATQSESTAQPAASTPAATGQ
jgi:general secretion pathway protein I